MNATNYNSMMQELRDEYLASFQEKFQLMKGFLEGGDWYSLELEFHKLKGTGTTYGVPEVSELCEKMEHVCRESGHLKEVDLNKAIQILTKIKAKYAKGQEYEMSSDPHFQDLKKL